jgi:uncharacterized protein YecE (DUF72 family)
MPPSPPAPVRCGPAGWDYPHWHSLVYPKPRPRCFHPLEYLAEYFDLVEINTTFYGALRPEISRLWVSRVAANPRFRFTAKLNRQFTHERVLEPEAVAAFARGLEPLAETGRLGCVLMQFPAWFRFTGENRNFLIRLRRAFAGFPLVAEMRHTSWMREEGLGVLIDHHVGFCHIDPPPPGSALAPRVWLTSGIGYVRLHGRNPTARSHPTGPSGRGAAGRAYLYTIEELAEWKERIEHLRRFAESVFVVMTNDAGAHAVVNALELQALLAGEAPRAPAALKRRFWRELAGFVSAEESPAGLFAGAFSEVA